MTAHFDTKKSGSRDLPALGFGAAALGNLYQSVAEDVAIDAIAAAIEAGITYVDTAPYYGFGLSESRLGAALGEVGGADRVSLSTKVGRRLDPLSEPNPAAIRHGFASAAPFEPVFDYSYDGVMRSFEQSGKRLRRDRIDILFAHDLGRATHGTAHMDRYREFMAGGYRAMRDLKDSGAVGAIGLGVNEWQICEQALADADYDIFLLAGRYTLLDQTSLHSFLPICAARGISVIIGGPYNSGILASGTRTAGPIHFDYAPATDEILGRVRALETVCDRFGISLAAAALQFPLAHPQVACVVPGMAQRQHVAMNLALFETPIPAEFWRTLRADGLLSSDAPIPEHKVIA